MRIIDEDKNIWEYFLDAPNKAVYLPQMVWKEMYDFSEDSVLMVLMDEYYDAGEYIRSFDKYVSLMKKDNDEI